MVAEALVARWLTPGGFARRAQVLAAVVAGQEWRPCLRGLPGSEFLGDNLGDLRGLDLCNADLRGADFTHARLEWANLDGAKLGGAILLGANLSHTSLRRANCQGANLCAAIVISACLDQADLSDACLACANLAGASLRQCRLVRADLRHATLANAVALSADLTDAKLLFCDLQGTYLDGAAGRQRRRRSGLETVWQHAPSYIDAVPHYLQILKGPRRDALLSLEGCTLSSRDPNSEIKYLLQEQNWRLQLIGMTALLFTSPTEPLIAELWRLAGTSWVSLQSVAVAYLVDADFAAEAADRIRAAETGRWRNPKALGSIAALYRRLPEARPDLVAWLDTESGRQCLHGDGIWAAKLVVSWLARVFHDTPHSVQSLWRRSALLDQR